MSVINQKSTNSEILRQMSNQHKCVDPPSIYPNIFDSHILQVSSSTKRRNGQVQSLITVLYSTEE